MGMNSIKKRFYLFGILLTVFVTVGLIVQYVHLNRIITTDKKISMDKSLEYLDYQINSSLRYHSQYTTTAGEFIGLENWTENEVEDFFDGLIADNPYIKSIYFGDKYNNLIISGDWTPPEGFDWISRDWYVKALEADGLAYSDVFLDAIDDKPIIAISKPVYNSNNEFLGVVACDISIEKILEIVEETKVKDLGYSFLIDGTGNILAHPNYRYESGADIVHIDSITENIHTKLKETKTGQIEVELEGVKGHLFYLPIDNTDWIIGNFMSLEELMRNEWDMMSMFTTSIVVSIAIFIIYLYIQNVSIIAPIMRIDSDIRNINIEENISYRVPIDKKDPFYELRTSINLALDKTQEFFEQVEQDREELLAQHEELISSYNELAENIEQRKILEERLRNLSYRDQLTGLYNRRFFEEEIKRLDREEYLPISIIMADVNGLKLINDSFGHFAGDDLLKSIANIIKKGIRGNDIACRLSGDEFVIVLPRTSKEEAENVVNRFKKMSFNRRFLRDKGIDIEISISYGIGVKDHIDMDMSHVISRAEDYMYSRKLYEGPRMRSRTLETIVTALYQKSKLEETHSKSVACLCRQMGIALGMTQDKLDELYNVGLLHDIGKIAIYEETLHKPGEFTDREWENMRKHPEIGYRILSTVNEMGQIAEYVLYHHERYDGLGYPKGLKGEEIPLVSRILAIADSYEAMSSDRPYRKALEDEKIIEELLNNAGTQFDPDLVRIFVEKVLKVSLA